MKKFKCSICGHIHFGDNPPNNCPICNSTEDKFFLFEKESVESKNNILLEGKEYDAIIIGSGIAALSAAITIHNQGLSVIVLEKAKTIGGTSSRSGGRFWIPNNKSQKEFGIKDNKEDCLKYMIRCSYSERYMEDKKYYGVDKEEYDLLDVYYDNASKTVDYFEKIGIFQSIVDMSWKKIPYIDYQDHLKENKEIRGRTLMLKSDKGARVSGHDLVDSYLAYFNKHNIEIITNTRVIDLLCNDKNEVIGVKAISDNKKQKIYSKKGVIFGSGGFSHNADLMARFQTGQHYGGCSILENEGDLVNIAEKNRLKLGNMNNAFHVQSIVELFFKNPSGVSSLFYIIGDSIIEVNKHGKRVMNEKRNYSDRTMTHFYWDANNAEWTNKFLFLIFDQRTASLWQGFPPLPQQDPKDTSYIVAGMTLEDLSDNIRIRLKSLKEETANFTLEEDFKDNLKDTVLKYNEYAKTGVDEDFGRGLSNYDQEYTTFPPTVSNEMWPPDDSNNITMYPISDRGPYYAIILGAGTLDTNGGPLINTNSQMIGANGKPVSGLYGAGNCIASPTKNAYWGAGSTLGPAMTFGHIAAMHLVKQEDKER